MTFRIRQWWIFLGVIGFVNVTQAQTIPWELFVDNSSASACDVINANNAELVLLSATRELTIVSARDITIADLTVDGDGNVYYFDEPAGFITYDFDGDGFRTVWWVSLTGRVIEVDGLTGEPTETDLFPTDFEDVPCDACEFWDDQSICGSAPEPEFPVVPIFNFCGMGMLPVLLVLGVSLSGMRLYRRAK